jgi:hypothetical protein
MSLTEFNAALERHGIRVVCAKIEDATGKCPDTAAPLRSALITPRIKSVSAN